MKPITRHLLPLASAIALATAAYAQEPEFVRPEPVSQEGKFVPGYGSEGIVKARFTVKADGSVDDLTMHGFLTNQFLNATLQQTVSNWTFKPGTVNGEPVDFYNQEHMFAIRFYPDLPMPAMGPGAGGRGRGGPAPAAGAEGAPEPVDLTQRPLPVLALSQEVKDAVDEISVLVSEMDYDKAMREITKLMRTGLRTVFDYSLAYELKASVHMAMDEPFEALEASKLATLNAISPQGEVVYFLDDNVLLSALSKRFLLAATLRQNGLAWETYEEMLNKFDIPEEDNIHAVAQAVKVQLDSPEPLGMLAKITENKLWTHKPVRRIFTVTDVDGRLNQINARCERRNLELEYQDGVDWTLPASLGNCELDFVGRDGTTFTLYEFAE